VRVLPISSSSRGLLYSRALRRAIPRPLKDLGKSFLKKSFPTVYARVFWNGLAEHVHANWGNDVYDFDVVSRCCAIVGAKSILDVGCGSGRLFPLYIEKGIPFCGCDVSPVALSLARRRFSSADLREVAVEAISDGALGQRFDLAICHRVLQHIPHATFDKALQGIAAAASAVYVNELTIEQTPPNSSYMFPHDYIAAFKGLDFGLVSSGKIDVAGDPTHHWLLFRRNATTESAT